MTTMTRTHTATTPRRNTPFTIVDADGNPLCHTLSSNKANAAPARRAVVREAFLAMMIAAGHVADNGAWLTVDGEWYMPGGHGLPRHASTERGHVIADNNGGPACPCNLVGENGASNAAHGDWTDLMPAAFTSDPRIHWACVAAAFMPKTKAARAVNLTVCEDCQRRGL